MIAPNKKNTSWTVRDALASTVRRAEAKKLVDKNLLFRGRTIEKFPLCVKEKVTTTYVITG